MPKRPNAIAFANKDRTILCADKFGDVYALPTIECNDVPIRATPALLSRSATPAVTRSFHSQANEKTVHSKRNLAALENQKKQLEKEGSSTPRNGINPKKDPTGDFYHKLVLGHVSMLTDLTVGRIQTTDPKSGKTSIKELIITADRDEHIRVSRGMPQSHVIENFLLGHKEFVSRVHIPQRYPNILISGGGDTSVYIWDYVTGHLLSKQDMRQAMVKPLDIDTEAEPALAVSGITSYYDSAINQTRVFVICENNPNIFSFHLGDNEAAEEGPSISSPDATAKIPLAANPLSISNFSTEKAQGIIVAFDPMTAGTTAYVHSYPPFVQLIIPTGLSTPPQIEELTVSKEYSEDIALTFRGEWERALYGIEPLRKNCFDRDSSVKEEGGNGDVKASTG
jgi:tRNA (guanine-N(7)-)-methyltransferase subunit TRM82